MSHARTARRVLLGTCLAAVAACAPSRSRTTIGPASDSPLAPPPHAVDLTALAERKLQVAFVLVDGVYNTELTAPFDVFHHAAFHTEHGMHVFTIARSLEPVTSFEGLRILPDATFDAAPPIDVLVVPSAEHSMDSDLADGQLVRFVRDVGSEAAFVVSLCDGAFILAQAGLLDGRRATTFPSDIASLRTMFPPVRVLANLSFVHDGPAITSAGGALSFEPALYLCELLYGRRAAEGIGQGLCIDWRLDTIDHLPDARALRAGAGQTGN